MFLNEFVAYGATGTMASNLMGMLPMLAVWGIVFYFLLIRPNKKKQKNHQDMIAGLKEGTIVITAGGIKGEVVTTSNEFVVIRVDKGVRLTVKKGSIGSVHVK